MKQDIVGLPTFHTRVENWECDFNGHWNTRFYARSFQMAAEAVASLGGRDNPGAAVASSRHLRFHRELFPGAPVEVRSAVVAGGRYHGAIVHFLCSSGAISATSLELPGMGAEFLPCIPIVALSHALPRGLEGEPPLPWLENPPFGTQFDAEVGAVRPSETDHAGRLVFDEIIRRCAHAYHEYVARMGLSPEFTERTGVGRMLVELRGTLLGHCTPGALLRVSSRLSAIDGKSFTTAHYVQTRTGEPVALVELCALAVDLKTRKAIQLPDFLRSLFL